MEVNPDNACHTEIGGKLYYFCRAGCKASFKRAYFKKTVTTRIDGSKTVKGGGHSCH